MLKRVNNAIIIQNQPTQNTNPNDPSTAASSETPPDAAPNNGILLIDAISTPAYITYPTDLKLLNKAREKTEYIIDVLHHTLPHKTQKPSTYGQKARKDFVSFVLNKNQNLTKYAPP